MKVLWEKYHWIVLALVLFGLNFLVIMIFGVYYGLGQMDSGYRGSEKYVAATAYFLASAVVSYAINLGAVRIVEGKKPLPELLRLTSYYTIPGFLLQTFGYLQQILE